MKVLVTCPPMLGQMSGLRQRFSDKGVAVDCPDVVQTLSEEALIKLVPGYDGWIIGDDPATERVFVAGRGGRLKAAVKWGIGVDNVDLAAARRLGIPISNTPGMFGAEVADVAMCYLSGLARELFRIHSEVRQGGWPKPCGVSLRGKTVGLIGYGDIGSNFAVRAAAAGMQLVVYDPACPSDQALPHGEVAQWPRRIDECDFLVFTCSLNEGSYRMFNSDLLPSLRRGVRVVNVARGDLIDEQALITGLEAGIIYSAAMDVMASEPLPADSPLRSFDNCVFGSHNASNTKEAVLATSEKAIGILFGYLGLDGMEK